MRVGLGYDIHQLTSNRKLVLGGVQIPYEKGLLGHSDADVLTHAIIDSLFGAYANGNIGSHFPDTDPEYKDSDSLELLKKTKEITKAKIINIDCNIIAQSPKLTPYVDLMRKKIANALEINKDQVSIKPKTNEHLDSTGKGEAISAQAIVFDE